MEDNPVSEKCPTCGYDFNSKDSHYHYLYDARGKEEVILRKKLSVALDELNFLEPRVSEYLIDSIRRTYAEIGKINE